MAARRGVVEDKRRSVTALCTFLEPPPQSTVREEDPSTSGQPQHANPPLLILASASSLSPNCNKNSRNNDIGEEVSYRESSSLSGRSVPYRGESLKQNETVKPFRERTHLPAQFPYSHNQLVFGSVLHQPQSLASPDTKQQQDADTPAPSVNLFEFAQPRPVICASVTGPSGQSFPPASFGFTPPTSLHSPDSDTSMVALTTAHKPVLHKSHSVAFGVDSMLPHITNGEEEEQEPMSQSDGCAEGLSGGGSQHQGGSQRDGAWSGRSPALSVTEHIISEAHGAAAAPAAVSSPLRPNDLKRRSYCLPGPQDSLGFSVPPGTTASQSSPPAARPPFQRSGSLGFDQQDCADMTSTVTSHDIISTSTDTTSTFTSPARGRRFHSQGGPGKWRSSFVTHRSAVRIRPLPRSESRSSGLVSPLSSGNELSPSLSSLGRPTTSFDSSSSSSSSSRDRRCSSSSSSNPLGQCVSTDDVTSHSVDGCDDKDSDANNDIVTQTGTPTNTPTTTTNPTIPLTHPLTQQAHSPVSSPRILHRQLSRRRSYQQATASITSSSAPSSSETTTTTRRDGDDGEEQRDAVDDDDDSYDHNVWVGEEEEVRDRDRRQSSTTPPVSPRPAKTRRMDKSNFDPYQIFEVQHLPCIILTVRVIQGRNITNGWVQDMVDIPDPYVKLRLKTAPEGRQSTRVITDNTHPVWNETFTFFLGFSETNVLELTLMEANPSLIPDQEIGTVYFNVHESITEFNKWQTEVFNFNGVSEVDVAFHMEWDQNPTLRYSLCLSDKEKEFMRKRKIRVWQALNTFLGDQGPRTVEETPTIAVIGSGGGFRAMTGYSGVFKALADSGLLDCATYACGLSGSSWYLSTLYSHPRWPEMNPGEIQSELMHNIDKSLMRLLKSVYRYINSVLTKRKQGQPVSFTDFFGHMVGETLLKGRMDCRLTDQRDKIQDAAVPMPLYTCVHVKKDVPARSFQEWVEFSPYEIGMPKYGTFMDSELFGSKFFMGKLAKKYEEPPLHFLQGIWGSAFCILFKRLMDDNRNLDPAEMIRQEMGETLEEQNDHLDTDDSSDLSDEDDDDTDDGMSDDDSVGEEIDDEEEERGGRGTGKRKERRMSTTTTTTTTSLIPTRTFNYNNNTAKGHPSSYDSTSDRDTSDGESSLSDSNICPPASFLAHHDQDSSEGFDDVDEPRTPQPALPTTTLAGMPVPKPIRRTCSPGWDRVSSGISSDTASSSSECPKKGVRFSHEVHRDEMRKAMQQQKKQQHNSKKSTGDRRANLKRAPSSRRGKSRSYWSSMLKGILESQNFQLLNTRAGRAAVIHNFMRGLNLQQTYPLSPFTPLNQRVQEGDEFDGIFDMHPTHIKHIYMVDAGLTFNSPFPLVLRPQRQVDVILSFDFSAREGDSTPPFKELLLAEKWAKLNRLPFPPIDPTVVDREGLKEMYVFQDKDNPHCPVVLHFPLVNINFRNFKTPGVPRETREDEEFANFDIFDDPAAPFSTFNFTYTHQNFQRLSKLTEFNTLHSVPQVKEVLAEVVARKKQALPRPTIQSHDFKLLRMKSVQERRELKKFLKRMESRANILKTPTPTGSEPPTPYFTPTPLKEHARERNPFVFTYKSKSSSSSSGSQSSHESNNPFIKNSTSNESTNPFFSSPRQTSRQTSQSKSRKGSYKENPKSPGRRQPSPGIRHKPSTSCSGRAADEQYLSASSHPVFSPTPSISSEVCDDVFERSPSSTPITAFPPSATLSYGQEHASADSDVARQDSFVSVSSSRVDGRLGSLGSSEDEFYDAAVAFTRDGRAVTDPQEAKMYYEGPKRRRQLFRRQSTISTLNSITQSISLDSSEDTLATRQQSRATSIPSSNIEVDDLEQFEGIPEDISMENNNKHLHHHSNSNSFGNQDSRQVDPSNDIKTQSHRDSVDTLGDDRGGS